MRRAVPIHYLRPNHAEWTPPHIIILDSETRTVPDTEPELQVLRLWCARLIDRKAPKDKPAITDDANGDTAEQLAEQIEDWTRGRRTTWLFAHNLSFDLVTTRLPLMMAGRGWKITDAAVGGRSPWLRLAYKDRRLCLVDSGSFLPKPLAELGTLLRIPKPPLPEQDDSRGVWVRRCEADVDILASAVTELLDWWDRNALGRFTISGAGAGWNAMRHKPSPQRITIDPDPDGIKADRALIHGGRRNVWRVGHLQHGPFIELDFTAAYPTVAATLPLPVGRKRPFTSLSTDDWRIDNDRWGISAEVTLRTDVPRWPVRIGKVNWHPVGTFTTTLAGPEIAEARRLGCLVSIGAGYVHQLGYAMEPWARWCLAVQRGDHDDSPPMAQVACKAWGRSVIGKWAAHSYDKVELGPAPTEGWSYEEGFDHESQSRGGIVDLAGKRWWISASLEGDNAYPAVLAWVESHVRLRLSRVIEAIGPGAVVQADTDGLIVSEGLIGTRAARGNLVAPDGMPRAARTRWVLDCLDPVLAPLNLRIKRSAQHVSIIGPQHLQVDAQRRLAGIPGNAQEVAPGQFEARLWPKLQWQMRNGNQRGYVRPLVTPKLAASYVTGWVTSTNEVIAPAAYIDADGRTRLRPWLSTPGRRPGQQLAGYQHPVLDGLW